MKPPKRTKRSWSIRFDSFLFQVSITFHGSKPGLTLILDYSDWRSYIFVLQQQQKELPERCKKGEILYAVSKTRNFYTSSERLNLIAKHYKIKNKVKLTGSEKETGLRKNITLFYPSGYQDNIILFFDSRSFLQLRSDLLKADQAIQKKLAFLKRKKSDAESLC